MSSPENALAHAQTRARLGAVLELREALAAPMYFKQFLHDETGCASYFLASRQSREAMIVDPQLDVQPYLDLADERDYAIVHVADTHLHADHISGNRRLAAATGAMLSLHEDADVSFPFNPLHDGEVIHLGQ